MFNSRNFVNIKRHIANFPLGGSKQLHNSKAVNK